MDKSLDEATKKQEDLVDCKPKICSYLPAGIYPQVFMSESSLYVKLLPLSQHRSSISFEEKGRGHVVLHLYDRDVHVVRNTHHAVDLDFDFQFNNSIFAEDNIYQKEFGVDRVLISAHNGLHELKKDRRNLWRPTNSKLLIYGDSGGAQLRLGTTPYIDPNEIIDWMNDFVDIGAALDIVPRTADIGNKKLMFGMAEVQRRCNELFSAKRRGEDLTFMNVVHGFNFEDSKRWCNQVKTKDPAFVSWAAGMDNVDNFFDCVLVALTPMLEFQEYAGNKGLHFFGVSGKTMTPVLAWLAKKSGIPITMDSTNYLRGNRYRRYYQIDWRGMLREVEMGYKANLAYKTELPCQCPVCYSLKWAEAFNLSGGAKMQHMLTIHNLHTMFRFVKGWNDLASMSTLEKYKATIAKVFHIKDTVRGILDSIDFIESCIDVGLTKTKKEFSNYIYGTGQMIEDSKMEALFPGEGPKSSLEDNPSMVGQKFMDSSSRILYRYLPKKELNMLWEEEKRKNATR